MHTAILLLFQSESICRVGCFTSSRITLTISISMLTSQLCKTTVGDESSGKTSTCSNLLNVKRYTPERFGGTFVRRCL